MSLYFHGIYTFTKQIKNPGFNTFFFQNENCLFLVELSHKIDGCRVLYYLPLIIDITIFNVQVFPSVLHPFPLSFLSLQKSAYLYITLHRERALLNEQRTGPKSGIMITYCSTL